MFDIFIAQMNIYAKKSLGQHFLTSKQVVFNLIRAAGITKNDIVLEVGPGRGFITEELVKTAKKVIAVEKDAHLADFLQKKFTKETKSGILKIVPADILNSNLSTFNFQLSTYKLVGAIPYYITGKLLRTALENPLRPQTIAFVIQKEVAERIIAKDGKENLLSLSVKAFGTPRYVQTVPAGFFSPPPKVDSAILVIENISDPMFGGSTSKHWFFRVLRAGFAHKRKMLLSSLAEGLKLGKDTLSCAFDECGIPHKARPEEVPLEKWECLASKLKTQSEKCKITTEKETLNPNI